MRASEVIIFSDMDGTMLTDWHMGPYVPKVNIDAIKRFMDEGGLFSIASGRQFSDTLGFFGGMKFSAPMVQGNGAVIYDSHKQEVLRKIVLPESVKIECLDYFRQKEDVWLVAADEYDIHQVKSGDSNRDSSLNDMRRNLISVEDYIAFEPVKVCFVIKDAAKMPAIARDIRNFKNADMFCGIQSSPFIFEFLEKSVGKAPAVKEAIRLAGAEERKLVCIGDYDNDFGMLKLADIAACPANSSPSVLKMAQIITCSNNEGALADLIRRLDTL